MDTPTPLQEPQTKSPRFAGSKAGSGIAQWIISAMPAHSVYVEAFLGTGKIIRTKLPASEQIGIERDPVVISRFHSDPVKPFRLIEGNALELLPALTLPAGALVYADPPYLMTTRSSQRNYYRCELSTVVDHTALLTVLQELPCNVMLSGYDSELYRTKLADWRRTSKWTTNSRGKPVEEFLWMNFPEPVFFHDTRFAGSDFSDRQRIARKVARWQKKFLTMSPAERAAVIDGLLTLLDHSRTTETERAALQEP